MAPLEIRPRGSMPRYWQMARVSGAMGMASSQTSRPTPEAVASSTRAPRTPPSVTSCMAVAPAPAAMVPSGMTLSCFPRAWAPSKTPGGKWRLRRGASSPARMAVPSRPALLVRIMLSPGRAPELVTRFSLVTLPTAVALTTTWFTTGVISVCPPRTATLISAAVWCISWISGARTSSPVPGGRRRVKRMPTGSAPVAATSLQETWTASLPRSAVAPVIGSVDRTSRYLPRSRTAQSSPNFGPTRTSLRLAPAKGRTALSSISGGIFPVFIVKHFLSHIRKEMGLRGEIFSTTGTLL